MSNGFLAVPQFLAITVPRATDNGLTGHLNHDAVRLAILVGVGAALFAIGILLTPTTDDAAR